MNEAELDHRLAPLKAMFLAQVVHALIRSGFVDDLRHDEGTTADELADRYHFDPPRVRALIRYAAAENLVVDDGDRLRISPRLEDLVTAAPWYDMFVGGYGRSMLALPELLRDAATFADRDVSWVGKGSAEIGRHDVIPLFRKLLAGAKPKRLVDLGSADGICLAVLGHELGVSNLHAIEPDEQSADRARNNLAGFGGAHVTTGTAQEFVEHAKDAELRGTFIVAFVLHELLAQNGRGYVVDFLRRLLRHPSNRVLIAEVDPSVRDNVLSSGLGASYYNPYLLLHELTRQELRDGSFWAQVVKDAGGELEGSEHPDEKFDSTRIEFVWSVRPRRSSYSR